MTSEGNNQGPRLDSPLTMFILSCILCNNRPNWHSMVEHRTIADVDVEFRILRINTLLVRYLI